jgi:hypothetical protein
MMAASRIFRHMRNMALEGYSRLFLNNNGN